MKYFFLFCFVLFSTSVFATDKPDDKTTNDVVDVASGLPITVDDASTQELHTWSSQFATHFEKNAADGSGININPEIQYGLAPNTELSVGIPYTLRSIEGSHNDNVDVGLKYNFVEEKNGIPALSLQEDFSFPTAKDAMGTDLTTTFALTKHVLPQYGVTAVYFNAAWTRFGSIDSDDRRNAYAAAAGFSHGITQHNAIVADIVEANEEDKSRSDTLAELGLRHGVNKDLIVNFGSGIGLNKNAPDFTLTTGLEYGF